MDVEQFLGRLRSSRRYHGQLTHVEHLAAREGRFASPSQPLPDAVSRLLSAAGIDALYSHQAAALDAARAGRDWVVVSGTASGKTLCYNLPILEASVENPGARTLYLFPTKALAQDQRLGLERMLQSDPELMRQLAPGVFDGDTSPAQRRRIQAESQLVLSNPDMLHATILPQHPKWSRFFAELRYIVIDEVHMYRGILGAHVACVLRRLQRICRHYGAEPRFLAASATIANPAELTSQLIGRDVELIADDGSPRGEKWFALWDPSPLESDHDGVAQDDAVWLLKEAMEEGAQCLAFTRTRQSAELINRYVQQEFNDEGSPLARRMRAYRGGYLPEERRAIEAKLASGDIRGVAATNALELGVDIGSLDVALLVHYPGTIASAWQQAGRCGRRHDDSVAVLISGNDPIDQYLLRHPEYFFTQSPEHAVVDPENPYVLAKHLQAAAFELPLSEPDCDEFGATAQPIADALCDAEQFTMIDGHYYHGAGGQSPALRVSLRHMSDNTFSIVLRSPGMAPREPQPGELSPSIRGPRPRRNSAPIGHEVIANVDAISAPELVYPEAIYLHNGESFFVRELDLEGKVAYVERRDADYYTQAVLESSVKVNEERLRREPAARAELGFGDADVSWKTVAFKKIKFETRENIGFGSVDIPAQNLPTTALWLTPDKTVAAELKAEQLRPSEALCGLRNLAVVALPLVAMCDSRDISGVVDTKNFGRSTLILYDRYPGGLGYCEKGYACLENLLEICRLMVDECPCDDGCPSCVGLPNLRPAIHSDPDLTRGYPIPDKRATQRLLELLPLAAVGTGT
ncbi:MAG: DEAD/DEAH box helicase [Planctomycetales bacterium]|nr:DEAD/DEAH box helicase [Planctomycetales bacterium]